MLRYDGGYDDQSPRIGVVILQPPQEVMEEPIEPRQPPPTIELLLIDDDPAVRDTLMLIFSPWTRSGGESFSWELPFSLRIRAAAGGREGVEQFRLHPTAVVLIDMRMPGDWDGVRTAQAILAIDPTVRVIFITAYHDYDLPDLHRLLGANFAFVKKPFDEETLMQSVLVLANDWLREQHLRQTEQELRQAQQTKDEFLASMSHELRTPLTTIIGNCDYLLEQVDDPALQDILHSIEVAGETQLALVNDLLDISKIESGKFSIDELQFALPELLQRLQQMLATRAQDSGVEFKVTPFPGELPLIYGDPQRISQILTNLVGNAIKFSPAGKVEVSVTLERDKFLLFKVSDNGIGIAPQALVRLFQRFEQASAMTTRQFGGSGLGLYISRNLAIMMGGDIAVESEEGVGSTFTLRLPYRPGDRPAPVAASSRSVRGHYSPLQGHLLLAEDTPALQRLVQRMLEGLELTVELAADGVEAVQSATSRSYDLILMDMQMPRMDGLTAPGP